VITWNMRVLYNLGTNSIICPKQH